MTRTIKMTLNTGIFLSFFNLGGAAAAVSSSSFFSCFKRFILIMAYFYNLLVASPVATPKREANS